MSASTTHLLRAPFLTEPVNPRRTLRELQAVLAHQRLDAPVATIFFAT